MKKISFIITALAILSLWACTPQEDVKIELPAPPTADFEMVTTSSPNKIKFVSKSTGAFQYRWDLGNNVTVDTVETVGYYPFKGTYKVTLFAFGKGGMKSISKEVVIAKDDVAPCAGKLQLLTGCSTKTWKLAPEANSLHVGPTLDQTWWGISAADVTKRPCQYNDEYTFKSDGSFILDNKGDFWADTDGNGNITPADMGLTPGCQPAASIPAKYSSWGSGNHKFTLIGTELTVIGKGAHIALYKLGTGAEVTTPQESVKFTVTELTETKMVLSVNFGPGFWRFTLVPK